MRNDGKHNTLDQRTSVMEFSFSRRSEIFVSRPKEKLSRFNPENGAKSWTKKKKKIRLDEEGRLCTAWTDYNRILIELKFNYNALQSSHVHPRVDGLKRACRANSIRLKVYRVKKFAKLFSYVLLFKKNFIYSVSKKFLVSSIGFFLISLTIWCALERNYNFQFSISFFEIEIRLEKRISSRNNDFNSD